MGSVWSVTPEDDKIDLVWETCQTGPKPFWIRLKQNLTVGEDRAIRTAGWKGVSGIGKANAEQEIKIDWKANGIVRAAVWITDWSLTDDKNNKLQISVPQIEALHRDVFDVIENAITAHVEAIEAKKKALTVRQPEGGKPEPSTTSD